MKNTNIIIVGVGGQGILLTSKILGYLALDMGENVKVSEVHGMSQRGGSVITHVRIGQEVHSPLIDAGEADFVLSFEKLEALRAEHFLNGQGVLISNTQEILPMPVIMGAAAYPGEQPKGRETVLLDALSLAETAGNAKAVNIVLLGVLSRYMEWPEAKWETAIAACVPPKTLEVNLRAFKAGRQA
ncbi:MAG: indolepyruvate oxidoreductase subunit beta [Clostridiales bacterium]|nr:indolepyruvate oxidoreductase subunit beta [Clostridiales bacterium]